MIKSLNNGKISIMEEGKKIHRSQKDRIIFGVCGGLAEYFDINPFLVRFIFVLFILVGGAGVPLYLILAILMPNEENSDNLGNNFGEEVKKRTKELAQEVKKTRSLIKNIRNIIGLIIILLGLNLLFSEFFHFNIFTSPVWKAFCALLIIFIGVKIIENGRK